MAQFVNPYTFVPHVPVPERERPAGHAQMADDRYSGALKIIVTARTPLLIGGFPGTDSGGPDLPRAYDGTPIIPGSGLMGAVRSLHEALVGGCLRVLDIDRVPVHRHPASLAETASVGLRLAVVSRVDETGVAKAVKLCDKWIWIPAGLLPGHGNQLPATGHKLEFRQGNQRSAQLPAGALTGSKDRKVLRARSDEHGQGVAHGSLVQVGEMGSITEECWVLLITDTKARHATQPYFVAGRIGPGARECDVPESTWEHYLETVGGADDLRPESLKDSAGKEPPCDRTAPRTADVFWPPHEGDDDRRKIARRLPARRYLYEGQPVWVRVDQAEEAVTEIRLSELWRYRGNGPVGDRVGAAKPCTDPAALCWSCQVFGSADTAGRGAGDLAVQHSYRGHVRMDDLRAQGRLEPLMWHLAPLSSPRPGAGQFYLDNTGRQQTAAKDTRPSATWGSQPDDPELRPIRGRKFYWRTKHPEQGQHPRGQFREHQSKALSKEVALFRAGTVFEGRVCFDNLSMRDYGSLLAALDPRLMGWGENVVSSVGGGKPFGFGSVTVDVEPDFVQTAATRYLGDVGEQPTKAEAVQTFRDSVPNAVRQSWQALRHALTFGFVADDLVWYPPGGEVKGEGDFDKSFEFFALTSGIELSKERRQLVVLPDAADTADAQMLDSHGDVQPNRAERRGRRRDRR